MNQNAILVVARDAAEYGPLLEPLRAEGAHIVLTDGVEAARDAAAGQSIVLGEPDLVAAVLDRLPELRWVQSTWAGVTPLIEHPRRDYRLTGVKGVFGPQMAEYVLGYLLAHRLRLLERLGRQAQRDWWPQPSSTLAGRTLGILGTGSIGAAIARRARVFGLAVIGLSHRGRPQAAFDRVWPVAELADFLPRADFVASVLPDTPATRGLLDAAAIATLRRGAYFVNVGRGSVVDEAALASALNEGHLGGAALDVFREEPLPRSSPLWHAENTLVTAHVAARSWPRDIAALFIENYRRYAEGEALRHVVDFERGY
ncbi:MAG: D-2-hydroxyacid dehydrogenase [Xanthomonadales bacterium]